jgi:sulfur relay (sulfurtransferase) complex TusBCD TusD component (DsrE family)
MTVVADEVVVVARGRLADESAALALRLALAIPLGGSSVRFFLTEATCLLALAGPSQMGSEMERQMDSLIHDEEAPVAVERESLARLGLLEVELRQGVGVVSRAEIEEACAGARHCLVI